MPETNPFCDNQTCINCSDICNECVEKQQEFIKENIIRTVVIQEDYNVTFDRDTQKFEMKEDWDEKQDIDTYYFCMKCGKMIEDGKVSDANVLHHLKTAHKKLGF